MSQKETVKQKACLLVAGVVLGVALIAGSATVVGMSAPAAAAIDGVDTHCHIKFFLVHLDHEAPTTSFDSLTDDERKTILELRWWSLTDLLETDDVVYTTGTRRPHSRPDSRGTGRLSYPSPCVTPPNAAASQRRDGTISAEA